MKLGELDKEQQKKILEFLKANKDVFAWSAQDL